MAVRHQPTVVDEEWYRRYYATLGADRNSLLKNPGVLFQSLAHDAALIRALQSIRPEQDTARVLDVGCGAGASLLMFVALGFVPDNLHGIDFQESRGLGT